MGKHWERARTFSFFAECAKNGDAHSLASYVLWGSLSALFPCAAPLEKADMNGAGVTNCVDERVSFLGPPVPVATLMYNVPHLVVPSLSGAEPQRSEQCRITARFFIFIFFPAVVASLFRS